MKGINDLLSPYKKLPREVYVIFFARMIVAMGAFVYPLMTLFLTKKVGMTESMAGYYIALFGIIFVPASLIGGKISDTFGRKKIIVICDSLAAICYIICGFIEPSITTVHIIMAAIFFLGLADPSHTSLIGDVTTPENRDGAFSLAYLGFNIGFAIGPVVGGMLFENHLRWFFIGDGLTTLAATALVMIYVKETIHLSKAEVSAERAMEKHESGSILRVLYRRPYLIVFSILLFGYNFSYSQWGFLMPLHVESLFQGNGASVYGKLAALNGIIVMLFTPILTRMFINKTNLRKVVIGGIFYSIGFGILGYYSNLSVFIISVIILTLGEISCAISTMPYIINNTPASHRGRMSSMLPIIFGAGQSIGPFVMGMVTESVGISKSWNIILVILLVSTFSMYLLNRYNDKKDKNKKLAIAKS